MRLKITTNFSVRPKHHLSGNSPHNPHYGWGSCMRRDPRSEVHGSAAPETTTIDRSDAHGWISWKSAWLAATPGNCIILVWGWWDETQHTRHIYPMFDQWWANVVDGGPALVKHWVHVSCLLRRVWGGGGILGWASLYRPSTVVFFDMPISAWMSVTLSGSGWLETIPAFCPGINTQKVSYQYTPHWCQSVVTTQPFNAKVVINMISDLNIYFVLV